MKQILQLSLAQLRGFLREPGILFWAFAFPILMAWVLGAAFDKKGEGPVSVSLVQTSPAALRPTAGASLKKDPLIHLREESADAALLALRRGESQIIVEENSAGVKVRFDPANQEAVLARYRAERALSKNQLPVSVEQITARGSRYVDFLVPGLVALGIMNSCMWGIGWLMIEFRMKKLLRAMIAASMKRIQYLISFFVTRIIANTVETGLLLLFAALYFGIRIEGTLLAFMMVIVAGLVAFTGIAILGACRAASTQVGNGILNAVTLPLMILSGVFFSYHNFPDAVVPIIRYLPLTLLADSLRAVFVEGAGVAQVWLSCAILCITGAITFVAGLRFYRWY
jgi:ABC-type multidrug transport system permease subunit